MIGFNSMHRAGWCRWIVEHVSSLPAWEHAGRGSGSGSGTEGGQEGYPLGH